MMILFALLLAPLLAHAQGVTTATLRGEVVDGEGAPLPGANVLAIHTPSGTRYGTSANENGRFTLPNMRVGGPYTLRATFVGYQGQERTGLHLQLGESYDLTLQLEETAEQLEEIEVTAAGEVFDPQRTGVSSNLSEEEIQSTPSVGRQLADFLRASPLAVVGNEDDDGASISIAGQNNRYNSIFIDGAVSNDVFGLSAQGTDGGQTGATPISMDAIEEFQISVSPYDVTQSGFAGGAINAVTRSGTNTYQGSFAFFRRDESLAQDLPTFANNRFVGRVGGPILEDELFFFANADFLRSETPLPFDQNYRGVSSEEDLRELRQLLIDEMNYDPGTFGDKTSTLDSDKFLGKLNWNLAQNHKLTARYSYTSSDNVDMFRSGGGTINYSKTAEVFPNDTHIGALQLNSTFGNSYANKLQLSYKRVKDDRDVKGDAFPHVTISEPGGEIELGTELFSAANLLEQDVYTLTNDFNLFLGDHTVTIGTHNELYRMANLFMIFNQGWYQFFGGMEDFKQTVRAFNNPDLEPANSLYLRGYSLKGDDPSTPEFEETVGDGSAAKDAGTFWAYQVGGYVQDEWQLAQGLRLNFGLRLDVPRITSEPDFYSDSFDGENDGDGVFESTLPALKQFHSLNGARPGATPDAQFLWSPRFGFNYTPSLDRSTQIRGGLGVFTSRVPFVWPGGMFLNNGTRSGFLANFGANPLYRNPQNALNPTDFGTDPSEIAPSGRLEMFEEDFKYPRVFRTSLGVDHRLPGDFVATLEGQYTNTLSNITVTNVNLRPANETLDGPDNRPIWAYGEGAGDTDGSSQALIDSRYDNIHRVGSTSEGYSYTLTAQVRKRWRNLGFGDGASLRSSLAYTYGDAFAVNDGTSSQINSIWDGVEHVNGANNVSLSRSDFSIGNRIVGRLSYRQEFFGNLATDISLTYVGESGAPVSYMIDNSANMVGEHGDPMSLMWVPRSVSQLELAPIMDGDRVLRSVAQQRADLERFISNNDYLDARRGDYAERNGDRAPFEGVVDLQISQEVFGDLMGRTQRAQVTLDIFNFSALLGEAFGTDWGQRYFSGFGQFDVLRFSHFKDPANGDYTPVYQSDLGTSDANVVTDEANMFNTIESGSTYSSQWLMQVGFRYTF